MISEVKLAETKWNQLPWKFEAGTPNVAGIVGAMAGVRYLSGLGMEGVFAHDQELVKYALEKLEGKVEIYGTKDYRLRAGVVTFNIKGVHAHDAAQIFDNFGIAVRSGQHCGGPMVESLGEMAVVRASFYIYNTRSEIDYLVEKIDEVKKVFKK